MSWRYGEPRREDYETEEDYLSALDAYDRAVSDYIDEYNERRMEEL